MTRDLQVVSDCYDLIRDLSARIEKFPRQQRYGLGLDMERRLQQILGGLIRCKHSRGPDAKSSLLREVNMELEVLRFRVRLAHDLRAMPTKALHHVAERMNQVGAQVGGWLRSLHSP